jgi:predicted alpha/beta hydrolase family esterase
MPNPWRPIYEDFKKEFEKYEVNEKTILIGHSCGCSFLVRWLGETKQKIKKLILVAPWKIPKEERNGIDIDFYAYPIDETIKSRIDEITMFTSDNEYEDGKKGLIMYHDAIGGKIINLPNHGHYILKHMGTEEFPELLEEILK